MSRWDVHCRNSRTRTARVACASDPYREGERYRAREASGAIARLDSRTFALLKASGLRGLGGAGFPTESKWQLVRQRPGPRNISSATRMKASPARFKDRFILTHLPHLVIEGMILAGLLTGAQNGILYIRHEYEEQEEILHEEIARCRTRRPSGTEHSRQRSGI